MTGAEIIAQAIAKNPFRVAGEGVFGGVAIQVGEIDQAVLSQWRAQAAAATSEQRAQIARQLRQSLMTGRTGGSPSLSTTAALIDMLEA